MVNGLLFPGALFLTLFLFYSPSLFFYPMEELAKNITLTISHTVEIISAVIIGMALLKVLFSYGVSFYSSSRPVTKEVIRVQFGSSVAIALELLLGADVLATAVAPSWDDIGKLAGIATIRTVLNYFLEKELKHIKKNEIPG